MLPRCLSVALALVAACSDDAGKDAAVDIDNGSCGNQIRFTGEYVDWDTHTAFCGIKDAVLEVPGGAMDSTAPNGRFDLCLPDAPTTRVNITQPAAVSQCSLPMSTYVTPTIIVANRGVIRAGGFFSGRSITMMRSPAFFAQIGQTFDAARGQVFVHVNGAMPRQITLSGDHGEPQIVSGQGWAAGDTSTDVFFPNVDAGTGTAKLGIVGGGVGGGDIPVIAGTITNVAVIAN